MLGSIEQALSYDPIFVGSWPVTIDMREGAHSGEGQYAESKTTAPAANLSRFGVLILESGLCIFNSGAASWSAMMYRIFGRLLGTGYAGIISKFDALEVVSCRGDSGTELRSGAMLAAPEINRMGVCGVSAGRCGARSGMIDVRLGE